MNELQREALRRLCERYGVPFVEENFTPQFDLPTGYVAGMVDTIYVGCGPDGSISS